LRSGRLAEASDGVWTFSQAKGFGIEGNEGNKERKRVGRILAEMRRFTLEQNG
jgi:hypothetical protein